MSAFLHLFETDVIRAAKEKNPFLGSDTEPDSSISVKNTGNYDIHQSNSYNKTEKDNNNYSQYCSNILIEAAKDINNISFETFKCCENAPSEYKNICTSIHETIIEREKTRSAPGSAENAMNSIFGPDKPTDNAPSNFCKEVNKCVYK